MQPPRRGQPQARTGPAKRHTFVGNYAKISHTRDVITHCGSIHWRIGLQVFVVLAYQRQQLLQADKLLQECIAITGQVPHAHQLDKPQLVVSFEAIIQ